MGCESDVIQWAGGGGSVRAAYARSIGLVHGASCPFLSVVSETNRTGHSMDSPG